MYAPADADAWRKAFFDFLGEVGARVQPSKVVPAPRVAHAPAVARELRDDEEWFFPGGPLDVLKAWLVAAARAVPLMMPQVTAGEAAAAFVTHFDAAVREPLPPGRERPLKEARLSASGRHGSGAPRHRPPGKTRRARPRR